MRLKIILLLVCLASVGAGAFTIVHADSGGCTIGFYSTPTGVCQANASGSGGGNLHGVMRM
jgi:hypothetical protein